MDPCQAEVRACASLIWPSGTELLHLLFSISSTDSFSSQNKKAPNKHMWVVFSLTFTSGQMSGCKDFQDARVHVCLLGGRGGAGLECLYVDNTRCDVQKLDSVVLTCPQIVHFPCVCFWSVWVSVLESTNTSMFHSWHTFCSQRKPHQL